MIKKKLLYASPFLPMKSGISDYSEILIYGLRDHFDITLLIDKYKLSNSKLYKDFEVLTYNHGMDLNEFDYKIYNIGNNPYFHSYIYEVALNYPGTIILHDYILYYLFIGYYENSGKLYSKIYENAGGKGINVIKNKIKTVRPNSLLEIKDIAHLLPLNRELLNKSKDIIVHSLYTRDMILQQYPNLDILKINMVDMNCQKDNTIDRDIFSKKFKINENAFVVASFGNVSNTKQNHLVCEAVNKLASQGLDIYYIMVGDGNYVDHLICDRIIKTGFVEREFYDAILDRCDIVANLRYPSMGETSISLIHAMGKGKVCMVTDNAWFSELPDDAVVKIDNENRNDVLLKKINEFLNNHQLKDYYSENAKKYINSNHNLITISSKIYKFLIGLYALEHMTMPLNNI